jgi:hypothetical protein
MGSNVRSDTHTAVAPLPSLRAGAHETVLFPAKLFFREAILMMELPKRRATSLPEAAGANADSEARLLGLVAWRALCDSEAPTRRLSRGYFEVLYISGLRYYSGRMRG